MDNRLSKSEILRGHRSYSSALSDSRVYKSDFFKIYISDHKPTVTRNTKFSPLSNIVKVGFIVSKKLIRTSVNRNYLKRVIKEIYRTNKSAISFTGSKIVLISFNESFLYQFSKFRQKVNFQLLNSDYLNLLNRMRESTTTWNMF